MKNLFKDLQLFDASAVAGKKIVYLYRVLGVKDAAANIAFVTSNSRSVSMSADSNSTKDGTIRTPGTPEVEIQSTSYVKKDDEIINALEQAMLSGKLMEIWEANLEEPTDETNEKFAGKYYQGYLTSFELSSSSDSTAEVSLTFAINGTGQSGDVTVSAEQQEIAAYVFTDTVAKS